LSIKQIQRERRQEETPNEEVEKRKIKVTTKTQRIFEIPLPTKDPELVEEVVKVLIGHIEEKMNTKVDGLHTLVNQPKIVESYEELDKRLQQWYLDRTTKRTMTESSSESSKKKAKVNMIKTIKNRESKKFLYEIEETIQGIEDQGRSLSQRKDQQVWFIDGDQGKLLKSNQKLEEDKPSKTFISASFFSTSTVDVTREDRAFSTAKIAPAEAPKAITRALDASKLLLNSETCPVILPKA
jgi:hypothetical protein